jgi:hypothetical protein
VYEHTCQANARKRVAVAQNWIVIEGVALAEEPPAFDRIV